MVGKKILKNKEGHRVIHRSLDDSRSGTAKTGVILEEPVGDDAHRLVIAQFDDAAKPEAFDQRELVDIGPQQLSGDVVMLYPRHLWAVLKKPLVLAAFVLAFFVGIITKLAVNYWSLSEEVIIIAAIPLLILILVVSKLIERKIVSKQE